jgi:protein phosphatase
VPGLTLLPAARSDTGLRRAHNEDAVFASPRLVAVADGVGGHAAGEVASRVVIAALAHLEKRRLAGPLAPALAAAIAEGNDTIAFVAACRPETAGMGTTVTAVAVDEDLAVASIGDSRAYLLRDGVLQRLTRDDSLVQELVDAGRLTEREARRHPQRSVVLAALDGDPARTVDVTSAAARAGDRLLLCSDGLSDLVDDDEIAATLTARSPERCADRLIELALAAGGRDNVSVVVADVVPRTGPETHWA